MMLGASHSVALAGHETVVRGSPRVRDDTAGAVSDINAPNIQRCSRAVGARAIENDAVGAGRTASVQATAAVDRELLGAGQSSPVARWRHETAYLVVRAAAAVHTQVLVVPVLVRVRVRAYMH
jgi:hypothetical protein